ncbi:helicase-related protein [Deinococcus aestuarii]|uniref:helicase-related protein n=1 Tax=Deinococcus aestuarii TaxID=2774531 RepID=UPI001C0BC189|nr:helicase-related protein [Deinococcus aestuarii]
MKLVRNQGADTVLAHLQSALPPAYSLDVATPQLSLFAFQEARELLLAAHSKRLILPQDVNVLDLFGTETDRAARNRLNGPALARQLADWLAGAELRFTPGTVPQGMLGIRADAGSLRVIAGQCALTTPGLGLTPGHPLSLIQCTETADEAGLLGAWFDQMWASQVAGQADKDALLTHLRALSVPNPPSRIYHAVLYHVFKELGGELDEERIVRSGTGIKDTEIWRMLFRFQRDGVVGVIDKLERLGGCIVADSVGLGKTFTALAVIKYYELRNDRVLVLAPKRLRDNWTLYRANDRRNPLAADRFHYDVLNHTDLSRDHGLSGELDLAHVNWGNYDLVVIDESHNFRNKAAVNTRVTRYSRLMEQIIQSGVKTRVLMLSATPVNNRLADLKNQIAFVTEGDDTALSGQGIPSVEGTTRRAQLQFNAWLRLPEEERTPAHLTDMLGFDYFRLLDLLTIARSRKHIQRYYGTAETGKFPERLPPLNVKAEVDSRGLFPAIQEINTEIRRLSLAAYAPMKYLLPHKREEYERRYLTRLGSTKAGQVFRQSDREQNMIHLLRVNLLKRMESAVHAFMLTLERQLADVEHTLARLDAYDGHGGGDISEPGIEDLAEDDPMLETQAVGREVKVLLADVDRVRWRQDLEEDRDRLAALLHSAREVLPAQDDKLSQLRRVIGSKLAHPLNPGNRKVIVFTAFADTAKYLYAQLSGWASQVHGMQTALVTGSGSNKTTLPGLRTDLASILTAFSPRSKGRPADLSGEGELDLLIATDCISEGQNLQDCDLLVNYDIHWNPVRIIQRFGRIDRIGSPNDRIQLVNFWPNMELDEYINLESRVSGRMMLLDISATGEENLIEAQAGNVMNDLEYRRKQLQQLQNTVMDLEDLGSGLSLTDLTLNDFRVDLTTYLGAHPDAAQEFERLPPGIFAAVVSDGTIPPGTLFCLRAATPGALSAVEKDYPLSPHFLVHVGEDGAALLPYTQAKQALDRLRKLSAGRDQPEEGAVERFERLTRRGERMEDVQTHLTAAVQAITGKAEERAAASLFNLGGTHTGKGGSAGVNDFEVVAYLAILPVAPAVTGVATSATLAAEAAGRSGR